MGASEPSRKHQHHAKQRKANTRKIVGKITYNPIKHKQQKVRALRRKLQEKPINSDPPAPAPPKELKFGSFNVNGLNVETAWAIDNLVKDRGFDVNKCKKTNKFD